MVERSVEWSSRKRDRNTKFVDDLPATAPLLEAAQSLLAMRNLGAHNHKYEEVLSSFLSIYRTWIIAARGMEKERSIWAERGAILVYCLCAAATLGEAIAILKRFAPILWGSFVHVSTREEGNRLAILFDEPMRPGAGGMISDMWLPTSTLGMFEFLVGENVEGAMIRVRHPQILPHRVETLMFGRPIEHLGGDTALLIPCRLLERAIVGRSADISAFQADLMRSTLHAIRRSSETKARVSALIWDDLTRASGEHMDLQNIAKRLGFAAAGLRRVLIREGTTFRALKEDVFDDFAKSRLLTLDSVELIAQRLGYSDSFSFRRAFRRHNGISPQIFRRNSKTALPPLRAK